MPRKCFVSPAIGYISMALASQCFAARIVSTQAGNWNSGSTWVGGVAPQPGDTVQIKHAVTVTADAETGASRGVAISGTGTIGISSNTITGTGTAFLTELNIGDEITASGTTRTVTAIASDTSASVGVSTSVTAGASFTIRPAALYASAGSVTVNAGVRLTVKGDISTGPITWTQAAGSYLRFDSSSAAGTPMYKWNVGSGNSSPTYSPTIAFNGSSGSHVTVDAAGGSGVWQMKDVNGGVGDIQLVYTDFTSCGDTSNYCIDAVPTASGQTFKCDHCVFNGTTGTVGGSFQNIGLASNWIFTSSSVSNPISTSGSFYDVIRLSTAAGSVTGTRTFTNNMLANHNLGTVATVNITNNTGSFVITGNLVNRIMEGNTALGSGSFVSNMLYSRGGDTNTYTSMFGQGGDTLDSTYFFNDEGPAQTQIHTIHPVDAANIAGTIKFYRLIWEASGDFFNDMSHLVAPTVAITQWYDHCINVPSATGYSNFIRARGTSNTSVKLTHNTLLSQAYPQSLNNYGGFLAGSQYAGFSGMVKNFQDNLDWQKANGTTATNGGFGAAYSRGQASPAADLLLYTAVTNNGHYNATTGTIYDAAGANGTSALGFDGWRQTNKPTFAADVNLGTGTNEITQGPQFVDNTRNVATFDTAYLKNAAGAAWTNSTSYAVGDIVSTSNSGFYAGATINFRCVKAHTSNSGSATDGQPGGTTATSYRTNWEFVSMYRIRQAVINGTTITDAGLGLTNATYIQALHAWVRYGFKPRNSTLHLAASDGGDIGAEDVLPPSGSIYIYSLPTPFIY